MGMENSGGNSSYQLNAATVEEMVLQTSGISASERGRPVMNVVPKEGSNTFRTTLTGALSTDSLESSNLTDELRARGLKTSNTTLKIFDESVSVGGPIKQDKLWFFGSFRTWGMARQYAGLYWNRAQQGLQQVLLMPPGAEREVVKVDPWVDRPLDVKSGRWEWYDSVAGRLTWQASAKHKFNFFMDRQHACNCGGTSASSLQEVNNGYRFEPNDFQQLTWNAPVTSRLLLEAGVGGSVSQWNHFWRTGVQAKTVSISDSGLGKSYGSSATYRAHPGYGNRYTQRFSATYVTGSHTMKTGVQLEELFSDVFLTANGNMSYAFRNGVPQSVTQRTTPYLKQEGARELGVFVQDQWRKDRWTFNYGVRYDYINGYVPVHNLPGSPRPVEEFVDRFPGALLSNPWVGERTFQALSSVPSWSDINPRLGASWDIFGNGRTALKMSIGRYVAKTGADVPSDLNPITTSVVSANRSWLDANKNYVPDCDLGNFAQNGECGALADQNFGKQNPNINLWDERTLIGWGVRDNNWDTSIEVQHELTQGLSLTGGYYYNTDSVKRVSDNILVTPEDYDLYCITAPTDSRLANGGGYQICGLGAIKQSAFGKVDEMTVPTSDFGTDKRDNHFIGVGLNARLPGGARLGGGFDTGYTVRDQCFNVDSPQTTNLTIDGVNSCRTVTPFKYQGQLKLNGSVPLPWDFVVSGVFQDTVGPNITATYAAQLADIQPSLGRPLAGGARSVNVSLIVPNSMYEGRVRRLDLRLTKNFQITPKVRLQTNLDAYNALNSSAVQSTQSTYGTPDGGNWLVPNSVLDPRILQVSFQLTF